MNLPIAVPRKLFKAHWFPAMRRKIKSYVMNYVTCLMTSASAQKKASYRLLRLQNPFRIMHTDHFVLLRESHNGVKHILLLIDSCMRFTWLFSMKSITTREMIKHFSTLFDNRNLNEIISNCGTAFSLAEFFFSRN